MVFSSAAFLFIFLPLCLGLYFLPLFKGDTKKNLTYKNLILCLFSLFFYAWGEPAYILLMILSIVFNFHLALDMEENALFEKRKKMIFIFGIMFNLFTLGFFKYSGFVVENLNSLFSLSMKETSLPLPVGISFYTFQIMSYIIDVYYGSVKVQRKLLPFMTYVTMFPQLIAGPIVQYSDIEAQLSKRTVTFEKFAAGIIFFIKGLGKKVLFANAIGSVYTNILLDGAEKASVLTSWIGIICYSLQLYFDFSGYSDMAIGLGKMFGFNFCKNFDFPYKATSITDFWRRWHISLSSWFRDYVYIPLGGNRKGTLRTIFNILAVWSLTGLWHGAAWNFVAWGAFYGILLIVEKFLLKSVIEKTPAAIRHILTMIIVMLGWVFFSCSNLSEALTYMGSMFAQNSNPLFDSTGLYLLKTRGFEILLMSLCSFGVFENIPKFKGYKLNTVLIGTGYLIIFILSIIYLISETYNPFLYFRF